MRVLLFGKDGQVGWELQRSLALFGKVVALGSARAALCGNLTDLEGVAETIRRVAPDVIVNAAAYTAVDKAESDRDAAFLVNARAPGAMAREAVKIGALLVHYSTDYVFDGSGDAPWTEKSDPRPVNVYGESKYAGEQEIQASGCRHLIFRSSWIHAARGSNFIKTMLRLGKEREDIKVVADQIGAPTGADLVADVTAQALRAAKADHGLGGLYHLAAAGETSWYDYARFVLEGARRLGCPIKVEAGAIMPVTSDAFSMPARRPQNSRLDGARLRQHFGVSLPDWRQGVERTLVEVLGY